MLANSPVSARNILFLVCALLGILFVAVTHDRSPSGFLAQFRAAQQDREGMVFRETYVVPVDSGEAGHYLRIAVTVEIQNEADRTTLTEQSPRVRDALISMSSDCSPDDLQGQKGMERTKHMMREALRQGTPGVLIGGVYFSEFLVR
jgi:flagellar basal body-associated protein FliL